MLHQVHGPNTARGFIDGAVERGHALRFEFELLGHRVSSVFSEADARAVLANAVAQHADVIVHDSLDQYDGEMLFCIYKHA